MAIIKKENTVNGEDYFYGKENNLYKHYKGGIYRLIGEAKHTEHGESLVVYSDIKGDIWARPRAMFYGSVLSEDDILVRRFVKI